MDRSRLNLGLTWADVTPPAAFGRRAFMATAAGAGIAAMSGRAVQAAWSDDWHGGSAIADSPLSAGLQPNPLNDITTYNNFYEFGMDKSDPMRFAHALTTRPWQITIDGLVDNPGTYPLEELIAGQRMEERIYRMRCVEGWSRIVPWAGFELGALLDRVGVRPDARYVAFETLVRPEEMRAQRLAILPWPYREGLRMDEARHPLTILATGIYRQSLMNQNGAPIRLVVPWKYGFKGIKSITRISLVAEEPPTTWSTLQPNEYGFYANVNPNVSHPRWSQATERVIGGGLFAARQPTLMFNGYEELVASMYDGMDLARFY